MTNTNDLNDFDSQIDMRMRAFIDRFMNAYDDDIIIMIASNDASNIDDAIIDIIDAQFDDDFAIICDDDDDAYSIYIEFISRMNESQMIRFRAMIHSSIRIAIMN